MLFQYSPLNQIQKAIDNGEYINWSDVSKNYGLTEEFMRQHSGRIDFSKLNAFGNLSEEFLEEFIDAFDQTALVSRANYKKGFLERNYEKIDWRYVFDFYRVSEELLNQILSDKEVADYVSWVDIFIAKRWSKEFYIRHIDRLPKTFSAIRNLLE